jgi:hypothetical protein
LTSKAEGERTKIGNGRGKIERKSVLFCRGRERRKIRL